MQQKDAATWLACDWARPFPRLQRTGHPDILHLNKPTARHTEVEKPGTSQLVYRTARHGITLPQRHSLASPSPRPSVPARAPSSPRPVSASARFRSPSLNSLRCRELRMRAAAGSSL